MSNPIEQAEKLMEKCIEAEITERIIHNWSTEFTIKSEDCKAYSPEILMHKICELSESDDPVGLKFTVCDTDAMQELITLAKEQAIQNEDMSKLIKHAHGCINNVFEIAGENSDLKARINELEAGVKRATKRNGKLMKKIRAEGWTEGYNAGRRYDPEENEGYGG